MADLRFKQAESKPYLGWIKEQLKVTNVKGRRWGEWDENSDIYEAFYETRSVIIPIPVCEWSFLVALHEIGHLSAGDRIYSYLREYNAEKWAIKRAQTYGIYNSEYVEDAKRYVRNHLIDDLIHTELMLDKVPKYVIEWIGESKEYIISLKEQAKIIPYEYHPMDTQRSVE